jgi:hypothetical protein
MKDAITKQIADGADRLKLGIEREPRLWPQTTLAEVTVHLLPDQRIANVHERTVIGRTWKVPSCPRRALAGHSAEHL